MNKKIVSLISAICEMCIGIAILIAAITDAELPKPVWFIFAVCSLLNAILIVAGYKKQG